MESFLEIWGRAGVEVVALSCDPVTVGKSLDVAVRIGDDRTVSRLHAVIEPVGRGWCVRDLGSRNGTFVNGVRVWAQQALHPGDELRVGATRLVFRTGAARGPASAEATVTVTAAGIPVLTARERDVLVSLCRPLLTAGVFAQPASTRQIAETLYVSEAAVKQHLVHLYDKFGLYEDRDGPSRRVRLANEAISRGAVRLADLRPASG